MKNMFSRLVEKRKLFFVIICYVKKSMGVVVILWHEVIFGNLGTQIYTKHTKNDKI